MIDLSYLFAPGAVVSGLPATGKKGLVQSVGQLAERVYDLDAQLVAERLTERERLGSTGFGGGVAIPHAKLAALDRIVGLVARLSHPVEFNAVDDMPVDLVFVLLSPLDAGADHLRALAQVSRSLRDDSFVAKLRGAASDDALIALLGPGEARDAA